MGHLLHSPVARDVCYFSIDFWGWAAAAFVAFQFWGLWNHWQSLRWWWFHSIPWILIAVIVVLVSYCAFWPLLMVFWKCQRVCWEKKTQFMVISINHWFIADYKSIFDHRQWMKYFRKATILKWKVIKVRSTYIYVGICMCIRLRLYTYTCELFAIRDFKNFISQVTYNWCDSRITVMEESYLKGFHCWLLLAQ